MPHDGNTAPPAARSCARASRDGQIREWRPVDDLERALELTGDAVEHETAPRLERLGGSHDHLQPAQVAEEQAAEVEVHVAGVPTHPGKRLGHDGNVRPVAADDRGRTGRGNV